MAANLRDIAKANQAIHQLQTHVIDLTYLATKARRNSSKEADTARANDRFETVQRNNATNIKHFQNTNKSHRSFVKGTVAASKPVGRLQGTANRVWNKDVDVRVACLAAGEDKWSADEEWAVVVELPEIGALELRPRKNTAMDGPHVFLLQKTVGCEAPRWSAPEMRWGEHVRGPMQLGEEKNGRISKSKPFVDVSCSQYGIR